MTLAQHLSTTQEHYTPVEIVEAARSVLGVIDLDPASCLEAQRVVKAERFFTRGVNGLVQPWRGRVFLNPPGGTFTARRKSKDDPPVETSHEDALAKRTWDTDSRAVAWWRKLMHDHALPAGEDVTSAVFVGFNLDILQAAQSDRWPSPMHFPFCVPAERLRFGGADAPTHGNVIVYTGADVDAFERVFARFGVVRR